MQTARTAAIVGGGVIGGGWAARFLLSGWDVRLFDPAPNAEETVRSALERARRSYPALYDAMLPPEGRLSIESDLKPAVSDAEWIQESVPERLQLKQEVYAKIQENSRAGSVIASSTSGFTPSELQTGARRPGEIIVAHPFNPVYLLPVVELVCSDANPPAIAGQADAALRRIGMMPLKVRSEIPAHIGDRLLEALWREALWLINDDQATTEEIDTVMTHGFGLRWAQMGLFETYRIAGGPAGMAHFIEQFGPCLELPWTRLTDTPELDSALAEKIGDQSDRQSGHHSIDDLEQIRDANLVTILRGLKSRGWGAGKFLNDIEGSLTAPLPPLEPDSPMTTIHRSIPADWIDYNGHVNESRYLELFSLATDGFLAAAGCGPSYVAQGKSYFTLETQIGHLGEAFEGDAVRVESYCLFAEGKKLHLYHILRGPSGGMLATGEHLLLHIDLKMRKSCDPDNSLKDELTRLAALQANAELPPGAVPKLSFN